MSEANDVINYINRSNANRAYAGQTVRTWPAFDNFPMGKAIQILNVYHDLVTYRNFPLPNTTEKVRLLSAEIRKVLGLNNNDISPNLTIIRLIKDVDPQIGADLYQWVFPNQTTYVPEKQISDYLPGNLIDTAGGALNDLKWIAVAGLVGYILFTSGILGRFKK